jgi:hypothetical protein
MTRYNACLRLYLGAMGVLIRITGNMVANQSAHTE